MLASITGRGESLNSVFLHVKHTGNNYRDKININNKGIENALIVPRFRSRFFIKSIETNKSIFVWLSFTRSTATAWLQWK